MQDKGSRYVKFLLVFVLSFEGLLKNNVEMISSKIRNVQVKYFCFFGKWGIYYGIPIEKFWQREKIRFLHLVFYLRAV